MRKRISKPPRNMHTLENLDAIDTEIDAAREILADTENDARKRQLGNLRWYRERCTHKRTSTAPRTIRAQEDFESNDPRTRDLRRL
ncbi:hypothetical protein PoB_005748300 [Plakobranchus ocellatus]|uniref:Uncharacterized protein n=1 Tax=Plakobranchus ocellatus TaxID=259542 RepID=A0AAV4CHG1_9GAST|nr:hypothetical protein PoB_005748300 [Plakobranchus ocellatus]